jgi:hypothetical protein
MKSKLIKFSVVAVVAASLSVAAQANPITGTINFDGSATSDNPNFLLATEFTSFSSVTVVSGASGTYGGVAGGTAVSMPNALFFSPVTVPVSPLWTFTIGATTYDFNLTSMTVSYESATQIDLSGSGTLQVTGYTDTPGQWELSANNVGGAAEFGFTSSNVASGVPDGGTTVLLLGAALAGLWLLQRRLA